MIFGIYGGGVRQGVLVGSGPGVAAGAASLVAPCVGVGVGVGGIAFVGVGRGRGVGVVPASGWVQGRASVPEPERASAPGRVPWGWAAG